MMRVRGTMLLLGRLVKADRNRHRATSPKRRESSPSRRRHDAQQAAAQQAKAHPKCFVYSGWWGWLEADSTTSATLTETVTIV